MLKFVLLSALIAGASAGYASSQQYAGTSSNGLYNQINSQAYADKYPYTNTGFNGGFVQNFAGPNGIGAAAGTGTFTPGFAPYQPVPAFPNAFDFNGFFQGLQNNFANLYQQQLNHQNALFNSFRQQQQAFGAAAAAQGGQGQYQFASGGAPNGGQQYGYAGSSASYGPGGFHQTAQIYPENQASPNIDTRFGGSQQGGPGFVGVSSFSSSSNINGQTHREAATSVNDNGKVTTYHIRS